MLLKYFDVRSLIRPGAARPIIDVSEFVLVCANPGRIIKSACREGPQTWRGLKRKAKVRPAPIAE
jgi:hypothetical protein